jgi:hypothetical protein
LAHTARVLVDDQPRLGVLGADEKQLVDLLLVLGHRDIGFGMIDDEAHLVRDRVLIDGHRDAAQHLRGTHGPVELRAVVADHRDLVAALETDTGKPASDLTHLVEHLGPAPGLPDAVILLAHSRPRADAQRVRQQQFWKRIGVRRRGRDRGDPLSHAGESYR